MSLEAPSWDSIWMTNCYLMAMRSKDLSTHAGCVLVTQDNVLISMGYNWLPRGIEVDPEKKRLSRENGEKYFWTEHAERNAIYNAGRIGRPLIDCKLYVNWIPCMDCARAIVSCGVSEVIIHKEGQQKYEETNPNNNWEESHKRTRAIFGEAPHLKWYLRSIPIVENIHAFFSGNVIPAKDLNGIHYG